MEFETAKAYMDRLGIEYGQDTEYRGEPGKGRAPHPLPVLRTVRPGFRPVDWMNIASRDGDEYIGGCCGQTSVIQDVICGWFRTSLYYVPLDQLAEVAEGMVRHDGKEHSQFSLMPWEWGFWPEVTDWPSTIAFLEKPHTDEGEGSNYNTLKPWYKLAVCWHLVKDHWAPSIPGAIRSDYSPADEAISIVDSIAQAISFHRVFSGLREGDVTARDKLRRAGHLHRFIPALKALMEHVEDLDLGTLEGWALVDLASAEDGEEPEGICQNGYGYCVYATRAEMNRIIDLWKKNDASREERKDEARVENKVGIRPIKIGFDLENGYTFTGPVERL
jgi:hypothetical protein